MRVVCEGNVRVVCGGGWGWCVRVMCEDGGWGWYVGMVCEGSV